MSDQPRHTRVPNAILDSMDVLTEPELRVLLAVARKTIGWQKECDLLSLTQLEKLTGLSRPAVNKALHAAIGRGWVECTGRGKQGVGCYRLTPELVNDVNQLTKITSKQGLPKLVNDVNRSSPQLVNDVNTQKKDLKEKKEKRERAVNRTPHARQTNLDSLNEAVATYKQLTGKRSVAPAMATLIVDAVTDIPRWQSVVSAWCGAGFRPDNVTGLLDWYAHPEKMERRNGSSKLLRSSLNGHSERKPQRETDLDHGF